MNEGTDACYNPKFNFGIDTKANYIKREETGNSLTYIDNGIQRDYRKITVNYDRQIAQGDKLTFDLYFEMQIGKKVEVELLNVTRNLEENSSEKDILVKNLNISLCLSDVQCQENDPNYGIERTDFTYKISYTNEQRAIGRISLKGENIGTDLMPKIVLTANIIGFNGDYDINTVQYSFKRKIKNKDERFIEIGLTNNNTIIDIPFEEGEINENTPYKILYKVIGEFPDGRTLDSMNQNEVDFFYTIDDEEEEKKGGIPSYAIIIIAIVSIGVIVGGGFLIYKFLLKNNKKRIDENDYINNIKKTEVDKSEDVEKSTMNKSSKRSIKNSKFKIINFEGNKQSV